ncbi:hypothetical protein REPUB_Repub12eG0145200 [Reevesia pubescens]
MKRYLDLRSLSHFHPLISVALLKSPTCFLMLLPSRTLRSLKTVEMESLLVEFRKALSKLPDMERLLARIFANSEANGRNANKVILYEDAAKKQLQEFISALHGCELMVQACSSLGVILENVESTLLQHLLIAAKGFPNICSILNHFKDAFDWVDANNSGRIIPHEGVDLEYDSECERVKEIELILTKHLKEQRKLLGDSSVTYVTVGKEVYLLEVPENLRGTVPRDYELRSSKKGFFRYWTPYIKKSLGELSQAESEKKAALKKIFQRLIFWSHIAELDVLISLAIASDFYEGPTCCPLLLGSSCSNEVPCFSAKGLGHPILRNDSIGSGAFVPNDITIGGSGHASFILLTGPNMGAKSTLLSQVCLAVILAQELMSLQNILNCLLLIESLSGWVPKIILWQDSAFLTELSETALMLSSTAQHSLVALDELGCGTSTSDGQAIAYVAFQFNFFEYIHGTFDLISVPHYSISMSGNQFLNILYTKCNVEEFFSTHYHRFICGLSKQFQGLSAIWHAKSVMELKVWKKLCFFTGLSAIWHAKSVMELKVWKKLCFFTGLSAIWHAKSVMELKVDHWCLSKSYGVNVARIAGIPDSVLLTAAGKSREFEAVYGKHGKGSVDNSFRMQSCPNAKSLNTFKGASISSLTELQHRARILLQQH